MASAHLKTKEVRRLLETNQYDQLRQRFAENDPADVADLLEELDSEELERVFSSLDTEMASEVIVEMEHEEREDVVDTLSPEKLAGIIHEMAPDDAADFFGELDSDEKKAVLPHLSGDEKEKIEKLLNYEEDSAGGLMTPELCAVAADSTVEAAIQQIVKTDFSDPISMVFAVDSAQHLIGSINIAELIAKKPDDLIKDIVDPDPVFAKADDDQEKIANNFRKYDLYVMPVINEQNRLLGRITVDDVMDIFHEEASEDIAFMAGAPDIDRHSDSPSTIVRLRLPWLMITMITGMVISVIIQKLIGLRGAESLAAFVPVIMAMGGNTGMQASAVAIRSIAVGEIETEKLLGILSREVVVGVIMGLICGLLVAIIVWISSQFFGGPLSQPPLKLALIVAVSMCGAMTFAAVAGAMMPILLHRFDIDPAVASGPFVTTGNDLAASLIYFFMCYLLLSI